MRMRGGRVMLILLDKKEDRPPERVREPAPVVLLEVEG